MLPGYAEGKSVLQLPEALVVNWCAIAEAADVVGSEGMITRRIEGVVMVIMCTRALDIACIWQTRNVSRPDDRMPRWTSKG